MRSSEFRELGADAVLADGSIVRVRRAGDTDGVSLDGFVADLSEHSLYERFLHSVGREEAVKELSVRSDRFTLVALREGKVIGHAAFYPIDDSTAEIGLVIADAYQGKGLGTILLGELAEAAHGEGIEIFVGNVSPGNGKMVKLLNDLGFPTTVKIGPGTISVTFPTSADMETIAAFDRRDALAAIAAIRTVLRPSAVAVIGASRDRDSIGGRLFRNLLEAPFKGPVFAVNAKADVVQSVQAYHSILDCPGAIDLAFIVVPASAVIGVAQDCAKKGVKALVVISSGFAETGREGAALQQQLVQVCRASGMRLIGPNCMGIVNTDRSVNLNGQFAPVSPSRGRIGFLSQSGALGIAVIEHANRLGLGMSTFVSVGNKADISGNDLIQYWEVDENTAVILLYLESFGNPRKFARIATRVTKKKPILAVKGGRSAAGYRATESHTGAILASSDVTVDALFHQTGVLRIDTLGEMFDVASLLVSQPVPKGDTVAIITNAGGAGILAADACEGMGLKVPEFSAEVQAHLKRFLSRSAGIKNPVDMIASATPVDYEKAIQAVSKDPNIDSIIVLFVPPIAITPEEVAKSILAATAELNRRIPVVATFMAYHGISEILSDGRTKVPSYPFPEVAARALSRAVEYGRWLATPHVEPLRFTGIRRDSAIGLVSRNLALGEGWLDPTEARKLLECYGIPLIDTTRAASPEEASAAASIFGGKVALKGVAAGLVHKTEAGAVVLNLSSGIEVKEAAEKMVATLASQGFKLSEFLVQPMVDQGVEMIVGITTDPTFGPVVACGAGGTQVELLKDVSIRLTPVNEREAAEMVQGLKTYPLLTGYRGEPPSNIGALEEIIERVAALAEDISEVIEIDLNPVIVTPERAVAVDFRVRLGERSSIIPLGAKKT